MSVTFNGAVSSSFTHRAGRVVAAVERGVGALPGAVVGGGSPGKEAEGGRQEQEQSIGGGHCDRRAEHWLFQKRPAKLTQEGTDGCLAVKGSVRSRRRIYR